MTDKRPTVNDVVPKALNEMTLRELIDTMLLVHRVMDPGFPEKFCELRAEVERRIEAIEGTMLRIEESIQEQLEQLEARESEGEEAGVLRVERSA